MLCGLCWQGKPFSCLVFPEQLLPLLLTVLQCLLPLLCFLGELPNFQALLGILLRKHLQLPLQRVHVQPAKEAPTHHCPATWPLALPFPLPQKPLSTPVHLHKILFPVDPGPKCDALRSFKPCKINGGAFRKEKRGKKL